MGNVQGSFLELCDDLRKNKKICRVNSPLDFTDEHAVELAKAVQMNEHVEELSLDLSHLSRKGGQALGAALEEGPSIRHIALHCCNAESDPSEALFEILQAVQSCTSLCTLEVFRMNLTSSLPLLRTIIVNTKSITELTLASNTLNDDSDARLLTEALAQNTSLQTVHAYDMDKRITRAVLEGLQATSSVTSAILDLTVGSFELLPIFCSLVDKGLLKSLCLRSGPDSVCLETLCDALARSSSITNLVLKFCPMTDSNAVHLKDLLSRSKTLASFQLFLCEIKEEQLRDITEGIQASPGIKFFSLWGTNIGDKGASVLAEALQHPHCPLERLDARNAHIGDEGMAAIAAAVKSNHKVKELKLESNMDDNDQHKALADFYVERNWYQPLLSMSDHRLPPSMWPHVLASLGDSDTTRQYIVHAKLVCLLANQNQEAHKRTADDTTDAVRERSQKVFKVVQNE